MATKRRGPLRALTVLLIALISCPALMASAADRVAFTIKDSRITESSGLTRDTRAKLYWTVNDSGDQGTVYGVTPEGFVKGVIGYRTKPVDVEAVAMSGRRLYVGDIGDNRSTRDFITVYYFDDPQPDNKTVPYRSYDFAYPDGRHDAETLLVDGQGRLLIVTKGLKGGIYRAPDHPSRQGVNRLKRVADAPAFVTDGVFLPGGNKIVLRTYVSVEVLDARSFQRVAQAATPWQPQGESVAVSLDGGSLLIGSEGKRSEVMDLPVPTTEAAAPAPAGTPPPSTKPTPTPPASDDTSAGDPQMEVAGPTAIGRTGTVLALSLAGFVALLAGVVVAAVRRP